MVLSLQLPLTIVPLLLLARRRDVMGDMHLRSLGSSVGWLVNSAMIIVAAAVFFSAGIVVDSIKQASASLKPLVGSLSALLFGVGLLAAGL